MEDGTNEGRREGRGVGAVVGDTVGPVVGDTNRQLIEGVAAKVCMVFTCTSTLLGIKVNHQRGGILDTAACE